jgi:hypothetical protein
MNLRYTALQASGTITEKDRGTAAAALDGEKISVLTLCAVQLDEAGCRQVREFLRIAATTLPFHTKDTPEDGLALYRSGGQLNFIATVYSREATTSLISHLYV